MIHESRPEGAAGRIVSLVPSLTESLVVLGLGDRVVGATKYCNYPEAAKTVERIGDFARLDLEKVLALQPDLILATRLTQEGLLGKLERLNLKVAVFFPPDTAGVAANMRKVAVLGGVAKEAEAIVKRFEDRLDGVRKAVAAIPVETRARPTANRRSYSPAGDSLCT